MLVIFNGDYPKNDISLLIVVASIILIAILLLIFILGAVEEYKEKKLKTGLNKLEVENEHYILYKGCQGIEYDDNKKIVTIYTLQNINEISRDLENINGYVTDLRNDSSRLRATKIKLNIEEFEIKFIIKYEDGSAEEVYLKYI